MFLLTLQYTPLKLGVPLTIRYRILCESEGGEINSSHVVTKEHNHHVRLLDVLGKRRHTDHSKVYDRFTQVECFPLPTMEH